MLRRTAWPMTRPPAVGSCRCWARCSQSTSAGAGARPCGRGHAAIAEFLDETQQFVERADRVLLGELAQASGALTLGELMAAAGPQLGSWPRAADLELVYALAGNMDHLEAQGRVVADRSNP